MRSWLTEHLPQQQPAYVDERAWSFARRYAVGESLQAIATEHGVTRQLVQQRIKRLAPSLGYG